MLDTNKGADWVGIRGCVGQGWEAVGRLRVGAGLEVERYAGSFFRRTDSDMDFPALHSDHSFAIQLRHDSALSPGRPALLQFALAYSTTSGQRRIRCAHPASPVQLQHQGQTAPGDLAQQRGAVMEPWIVIHGGQFPPPTCRWRESATTLPVAHIPLPSVAAPVLVTCPP